MWKLSPPPNFNQRMFFLILVLPPFYHFLFFFNVRMLPPSSERRQRAIYKTHTTTPTWQPSAEPSDRSRPSAVFLVRPPSFSPLFGAQHLEKSDILRVNRATAVHQLLPLPSTSLSPSHGAPIPKPPPLLFFLFLLGGLHVSRFNAPVVLSLLLFALFIHWLPDRYPTMMDVFMLRPVTALWVLTIRTGMDAEWRFDDDGSVANARPHSEPDPWRKHCRVVQRR